MKSCVYNSSEGHVFGHVYVWVVFVDVCVCVC